MQFFFTEINFLTFFFLTANASIVSFLSKYKFLSPTQFFFIRTKNMDPETQKLLRFNPETKQIVEELLQIFQRTEKNLVLLQQTNQIVQKLLEIFHKKNINFENIQHIIESISKWSGNIRQCNKILHNYTTMLRDRCHRIQDQFNQLQNNLVKD